MGIIIYYLSIINIRWKRRYPTLASWNSGAEKEGAGRLQKANLNSRSQRWTCQTVYVSMFNPRTSGSGVEAIQPKSSKIRQIIIPTWIYIYIYTYMYIYIYRRILSTPKITQTYPRAHDSCSPGEGLQWRYLGRSSMTGRRSQTSMASLIALTHDHSHLTYSNVG